MRAILIAAAFVAAGCAQHVSQGTQSHQAPPGHPFEGLNTHTRAWPGRAPEALMAQLGDLAQSMTAAMNAGDRARVFEARASLEASLGRYAGEPEEEPLYGLPIETSRPSRSALISLWRDGQEREPAPWRVAIDSPREVQRIRTSTRMVQARLLARAADAAPLGETALADAISLGDYLLRVQAPSGVFGYPYDPSANDGVRAGAARFVERARARGQEVVHNDWIVDDLGSGDLNFDNAQAGLFLVQLFLETGDGRYLGAAQRAGDWAVTRPLVANFNYNGFNGQLLSRLYRVTREARYLERAKAIFDLGVTSGQLPNGRWFDQHNAKIQYHAILIAQMIEFYLALDAAGDAEAAAARTSILAALDNLATEITTHGSSNTHEMLAVEALSLGVLLFGDRPLWREALYVDVNYLIDVYAPYLARRGRPVPDGLARYLMIEFGVRAEARAPEVTRGFLSASE